LYFPGLRTIACSAIPPQAIGPAAQRCSRSRAANSVSTRNSRRRQVQYTVSSGSLAGQVATAGRFTPSLGRSTGSYLPGKAFQTSRGLHIHADFVLIDVDGRISPEPSVSALA
jgi:hypothetical protein